jgi:hypothetical protein
LELLGLRLFISLLNAVRDDGQAVIDSLHPVLGIPRTLELCATDYAVVKDKL